jgi:hypothetical protein
MDRNTKHKLAETGGGVKTALTIFVTLVSGGAMGALITQYWTNRQTIVGYAVNTTSLGAGEATKSVLPNLKLQLGSVEIPVVYTHTIELTHNGGPELDQATIGISLSGAAILGRLIASGPDAVHSMACKDFDQSTTSVVCSVGRISSGNKPYKVTIATDRNPEIHVTMDAKNASMRPAHLENPSSFFNIAFLAAMSLGISLAAIQISTRSLLRSKRRRTEGTA